MIHVWNVNRPVYDDASSSSTHGVDDESTAVTVIALARDEKIAACGTAGGVVALWDLDVCQVRMFNHIFLMC